MCKCWRQGLQAAPLRLFLTRLCSLSCYVRFLVKNHFGVRYHILCQKTFIFFSFKPAKVSGNSKVGGACGSFSGTTGVSSWLWTVIPNTGTITIISHKTQKLLWTWNLPIICFPEKPSCKQLLHKALMFSLFFLNEQQTKRKGTRRGKK